MTRPAFEDEPPCGNSISAYDERHLVTYLRILDAAAEGVDWREAVRVLFDLDPEREPERSKKVFEAHLARARWMTDSGYRQLVGKGRKQG